MVKLKYAYVFTFFAIYEVVLRRSSELQALILKVEFFHDIVLNIYKDDLSYLELFHLVETMEEDHLSSIYLLKSQELRKFYICLKISYAIIKLQILLPGR